VGRRLSTGRGGVVTLELSHEVPEGSPPLGAMKEELSKAYIHMIASAAGFDVGTWGQDYDCRDVTLSSSVNYAPYRYGPKIDIQLKCTGQQTDDRNDVIAWSLDSRSYYKLSLKNRSDPALFCVLVAPPVVGHWLHYDQQGLLARSHMYWRWGHDFAAQKPDQASQTVHLPKVNVLTVASALELMEEASRWSPELAPPTP
jgi:Domain of unknown function (DUF4365)